MSDSKQRHPFERVDEAAEPGAWLRCLDTLHAEPFYQSYKARVRELIAPEPTGLYLEIGSGVGTDALSLPAPVIGADRSLRMAREAHTRGLRAVVSDAAALPFSRQSMHGAWADRTFQHLSDPRAALQELVRVVKPGGPVVVVDADYGTQTLEFPEPELAQKVLDYRAHHALRNGTLAHRVGKLFSDLSLNDVRSEPRTLVVTDPTSLDSVLGLRSWAESACRASLMTREEVSRWEDLFDAVVSWGRFRWSVEFFITSGHVSAR